MAKKDIVKVADLNVELSTLLDTYRKEVYERVDTASEKAVKKLVKLTKATAPKGERGSFKKNIAGGVKKKTPFATTYAWYVKSPDYRLTHLLVYGHETRNGGRTRSNPFLANALDIVLPEYEQAVEEAVKP